MDLHMDDLDHEKHQLEDAGSQLADLIEEICNRPAGSRFTDDDLNTIMDLCSVLHIGDLDDKLDRIENEENPETLSQLRDDLILYIGDQAEQELRIIEDKIKAIRLEAERILEEEAENARLLEETKLVKERALSEKQYEIDRAKDELSYIHGRNSETDHIGEYLVESRIREFENAIITYQSALTYSSNSNVLDNIRPYLYLHQNSYSFESRADAIQREREGFVESISSGLFDADSTSQDVLDLLRDLIQDAQLQIRALNKRLEIIKFEKELEDLR